MLWTMVLLWFGLTCLGIGIIGVERFKFPFDDKMPWNRKPKDTPHD